MINPAVARHVLDECAAGRNAGQVHRFGEQVHPVAVVNGRRPGRGLKVSPFVNPLTASMVSGAGDLEARRKRSMRWTLPSGASNQGTKLPPPEGSWRRPKVPLPYWANLRLLV